ncbi:ABC transporter ATP-binding protein [Paenibacillus zeisoli]|uniref:Carnitine transport ATP-binding protein OpuCA n=1 Tax=Paenibacillus zeisoli TaxID=2496267 RepID=A0A433XP47_9BACL|nr:ABC transporter ATP-binding protein [Paenibacillus zeisoli]RUT35872.1 ABC transporter ATP-binding protein [Paenibacillus zeisoli]
MSYLLIENVNKTYNSTSVLHELNLEVMEGEMVTLLGPSGCGKSTLLRCISGLTDMDKGSVHLEGRNITPLAPKDRNVGMVFQSYALFPNMNVYDNIAFGLSMKKKSSQQIKSRVEEMLQLIDLTEKAKSYPHELSGGQQQRVSLARSLAVEPKLMLMDEPLSALDAKIRKHLRTELRQIQKRVGMTMLFVTHDQEEALTISDKICLMNQGRIVQTGSPDEVYSKPKDEFAARFIGSYNVLSGEELSMLLAEPAYSKSAGKYALRPEAIHVKQNSLGLQPTSTSSGSDAAAHICLGLVEEAVMLGNIIRYRIEANGVRLLADVLNGDQAMKFHEGDAVQIQFDRQACLPLAPSGT